LRALENEATHQAALMPYFRLIYREMHGSVARFVLMSALGGMGNAAILATINSASSDGRSFPNFIYPSVFILSLIVFIITQRYVLIATTAELEAIIHRVRVRLLDKVRQSELAALEIMGRTELVLAITKDMATLTHGANVLAFGAQGIVLLISVSLYVAYLSPIGFALSVTIVGIVAVLFHSRNRALTDGMKDAADQESRLFDRVHDLLEGFKEVRLNSARNNDLIQDIEQVSHRAMDFKVRALSENFTRVIFSQTSLYALLGAIVFIVPILSDSVGHDITAKNTTALLFIVGTCFGLINSFSMLASANIAAERIERLEGQLQSTGIVPTSNMQKLKKCFNRIELRDVVYRYPQRPSEVGFQIGPIDFTLDSGDLILITGGNGSGKSSFMKMLSGLYTPVSGVIKLDGIRIEENSRQNYRELMAAVFSDYHLFHRLYGISTDDQQVTSQLLTELELRGKIQVKEDEFDTLDLSSGQRKRLALLVALLERKPILLLDEWTANQDPEYRDKFYRELLPSLRKSGLTIVLVTHDDRYLDKLGPAARRLHMYDGRFV
jgi:putative pyoverdin transport system ATP-binding/permease protein